VNFGQGLQGSCLGFRFLGSFNRSVRNLPGLYSLSPRLLRLHPLVAHDLGGVICLRARRGWL